MLKINPFLCFQAIPESLKLESSAVDVDGFIQEFIGLWNQYILDKSDEFQLTLHDLLQKHIGPEATFSDKSTLISFLKFIVDLISDKNNIRLNADDKNSLLVELKDPISNCTSGLYNRLNMIFSRYTILDSIEKLLHKIRLDILDKIARNITTGIHTHNLIFKLAQEMNLNIQIPYTKDPFGAEQMLNFQEVKSEIHQGFEKFYQPLNIFTALIEEIKQQLSSHYDYVGTHSSSYKFGQFNGFCEYLKTLFQEPETSMDYLIIDDNDEKILVTDLNWVVIKQKLISYLFEQQFFLESVSGERQFIDAFLNDRLAESMLVIPPLFANDDCQLLAFLKLGDETNIKSQLLLIHDVFLRLNQPSQLRLAFNLLAHFEEPAYEQKMKHFNTTHPYLSLLHDTPTLESYLENPLYQKPCVKLITTLPAREQTSFLTQALSSGKTPLTLIIENQSALIPSMIDILTKMPVDLVQRIILNKKNLNMMSLVISRAPSYFDLVLALYTANRAITAELLLNLNAHGHHVLMDIMHHIPQKFEALLMHLPPLDSQTLHTLWLQTNNKNMNSLSLLLAHHPMSSNSLTLSYLSKFPPQLIFLMLNQSCGTYDNVVFYCFQQCPQQASVVLKLISLLEPNLQLLLFRKTDIEGNNLLHHAQKLISIDYQVLVHLILNHGFEKTLLILNQTNSKKHDVCLSTLLFSKEKLAILFKQLSEAFSKAYLSQFLFSNPQEFLSYLDNAISSNPQAMPVLLHELKVLTLHQQLAILGKQTADSSYLLEKTLAQPDAFIPLFNVYLSLFSEPLCKNDSFNFVYDCCFSSKDKIANFLTVIQHLDSTQETTLQHLMLELLRKKLKHPDISINFAQLCANAIDEFDNASEDAMNQILDMLKVLSPQKHCQDLIDFFSSDPQQAKRLLRHFGTLLGFFAKTNHPLTQKMLDYLKIMPGELFFELLAQANPVIIEMAYGHYFSKFFNFLAGRLHQNKFYEILTSFNKEEKTNLLKAGLKASTEENIHIILSLPEDILMMLLVQKIDEKAILFDDLLALDSPYHQALVQKISRFSESSKEVLFTENSTTLHKIFEREQPVCDSFLDLMLENDLFDWDAITIACLQNALLFPAAIFQKLLAKLPPDKLNSLLFSVPTKLIFANLPHVAKENLMHAPANIEYLLNKIAATPWQSSKLRTQINLANFWNLISAELDNKPLIFRIYLSLFSDEQAKINLFLANNVNKDNLINYCIFMKQNLEPVIDALLSVTTDPKIIASLLNSVGKHHLNPLLYACKNGQLDNVRILLKLIQTRLPEAQQQQILSYETDEDENILTLTVNHLSPSLPELCNHLLQHPSLLDGLIQHFNMDGKLADVIKMQAIDLSSFYHLITLLPQETLADILFSRNPCQPIHFLDYGLMHSQNPQLILNTLERLSPSIIFDLITKNTLYILLNGQKRGIFNQFLALLEKYFSPNIRFSILCSSDHLFKAKQIENLINLFNFIIKLDVNYQWQILAAFNWMDIFDKDPSFCETFFSFIGQQAPQLQKFLLQKDALIQAVVSQKEVCVSKTIALIKSFDSETQKELFGDFEDAKTLQYALDTSYKPYLDMVQQAAPTQKRTFSAMSVFSPQNALEQKDSQAKLPSAHQP